MALAINVYPLKGKEPKKKQGKRKTVAIAIGIDKSGAGHQRD